jgi:hypothetical protein
MATRTVERFNEAATKDGRDKVITWCPSCHMHMSDIMAPGNVTHFDIAHLSGILSDRAERLAAVMNVRVNRRVLLHRHAGFATHVAVNSRVASVLSRISGLELIEGPPHPGHMCSALAAVPGTLAAAAALPGRLPPRTAATPFARSFIRVIANWRRWTARTRFESATGCISRRNRWE